MTEKSLPYDSTSPGDAGPFSAAIWAELWHSSIVGYNRDDAGVFMETSDSVNNPLWVEESAVPDIFIRIRPGNAQIQGYWYESDDIESHEITANSSGNDRIDRMVLRFDPIAKEVRQTYLIGTPAGSPSAPALTQVPGGIWDIPLAQIAAANLFASIVDADITDERVTAILRLPSEGGTGLSSIEAGELIVGDASDSFAKLTVPTQVGVLRYDSTDVTKMKFQDQRICEIYTLATANGISTSYTAETLDAFNDGPGDIVDTLIANQLKLFPGTYRLIFGHANFQTSTTAGNEAAMRLENITVPGTIVEGSLGLSQNASNLHAALMFQPVIFTMNGVDLIEWQFRAGSTNASTGVSGSRRAFVWTRLFALERVDT